jgi:signal transduction histidine kinase
MRVFQTGRPEEWEEAAANGRTYRIWAYPFADVDGTEMALELGVDVTERKELEKQVIRASETVQRSIGRDLHDTLGQNLTGLAFLIKGLAQTMTDRSPEEAVTANQIVDLVNDSVSQVRALARGLDPVGLHDEGLAAGLSALAANARNVFGVSCEARCERGVTIDDDVAGHLYHIAQEAVNNAIKHANVGHIDITLCRDDHTISLIIEDDGSGIDPDARLCKGDGLGMHIMRYRASVIGGSLSVGPGQWGGTVVACSLPSSDAGQIGGNANERV